MAVVSVEIEITDEDAKSFTNLGFEVTPDHIERAREIYKSVVEQNYFDDLFHALEVAEQDIADERV